MILSRSWPRIAVALALVSSTAYAQGSTQPPGPPPSLGAPPSRPPPPTPPPPVDSPPPASSPIPLMTPGEVSHFLAFFDALVDTVVRDAQSCGQMAADVSALIDANHDTLEVARAARIAHKRMPEQAQYHMLDGIRRMGPGIENCSENGQVKAAFDKLDDHAKP